ncbi:MAG: GGDEF and EAL domain-containing protein [Christensenellaceae bacterium]|nr:GGDEF and EAL domain-containing protein [Christensenellaceae bacterium]
MKIWTRLSIPILLVVVFQVLTYSAVLIFGGEFRNIREYAYSTLVEKTEYRSSYIRNELRGKPILVQEYAEQINSMVAGILEERGASIADVQTDKELDSAILESSVSIVTSLLRRSLVNDAYLILETGSLYADEGGANARAALYLRDLDPNSGAGYSDLLMEIGSTAISQKFGITRHSGWTIHFMPDLADSANADFYFRTIRTAKDNGHLLTNYLGYWSGFSELSPVVAPSMKYTMPLVARDGTVYGVIGVGMMESAILSNIPSNDFMSDTACYILGRSVEDSQYDIQTRAGASFGSLLGSTGTLYIGNKLEADEDVYGIDMDAEIDLLGSVQQLELYNQISPYAGERWALISVADRSSVLRPVTFLSQMLMFSALASLIVAALVAVPSCTGFIRPITAAIRLMKAKRKYNEVIHFQPSNIYEIDELTDAITQLQINVQDVSSEVSKMISVADVGLGTFRYDRTDGSVFVGRSLITTLRLQLPPDEDIVMTREEFLSSIKNRDAWSAIAAGLEMTEGETREDYSEVYKIGMTSGSTRWMRLGYTYSPTSAIGIVQDITDTMLEKQRIEYERDYDSLTGLMNRHAYYPRVEALFHDKSGLKITAFVMIDLDNLKYVNDTYGHDFGDDYIKTAATVLRKFESFGGIVARISGDEFNVCLPGFSSKEAAREMIAGVHAKMLQSSCLLADGTHFRIRASFGVSWYPDDAESCELLMKYADFAMYTIKHSTKGNIAEFDMTSYSADSVLLTGVEELNRIIEERSVRYAFQSIVSAKTGEIYGYEALMRVQSQIFQSPLELLRTAKTGAKLYEIERLTWSKSLEDFQSLIDAGQIDAKAHIFINTIANCKLEIADVQAIEAARANLLGQVVLEVLEGENANETFAAHKKAYMKKWNAQIALDDFGTGYNSEYALLSIQPNIIKIDRSITSGCDKDASRRMIINNLVTLARTKQILVLVEGVETEEEMKTAIACGVDLLQGYYLARPLFEPQPMAPEVAEMIRNAAGRDDEPQDDWSTRP